MDCMKTSLISILLRCKLSFLTFLKPAERASEESLGWSRRRNPRSALERHQARETGGSRRLSPVSRAMIALPPLLGLTPQALCYRLLRRLKSEAQNIK